MTVSRTTTLVLATLLACAAPEATSTTASAPGRHEYRRLVMGSEARLVLCTQDAALARRAAAAAFARLDALEQVMSDYREDSELMRLCAGAGGGPVPISDDLARVLARSRALAEATDGAFDPTVGPLVHLWRAARRDGRLPGEDALAAARALVGWRMLEVAPRPGAATATLARAGMRLDLGAIGKGFAADEAARVLRRHGVRAFLVDLGGDLALGAPPPGTDGWRVAIACGPERTDPVANAHGGEAANPVAILHDVGVATSGATAQFLEVGGRRYSHVLDPRTGHALEDSPCVTVVAPTGAVADALASAASVLGPRASAVLAARHGAAITFTAARYAVE